MHYQAILFDLDNTLYDYDACYRAADDVIFPWLEERTGRPRAELEVLLQESRRYNQVTLGGTAAAHNRLLYYQHLIELLGLKVFGLADTVNNLFWETFLANMRLFPGAQELLAALRVPGCGICLVTDMPVEIQYRKIARLGIADFIDAIVTSEEAGREKPHPWVFALALRKLGVSSDRVCMVGDDHKDIEGALLSGMDAYWLIGRERHTHPNTALTAESDINAGASPNAGQAQLENAQPEGADIQTAQGLWRRLNANGLRLTVVRDLHELREILLAAE